MRKYMFVIPSFSKGGAERVITVLSSGLAEKGNDVIVLRYFKTNDDYPISEKVKVITLSGGFEEDYKKIGKIKRLCLMRKIFKDNNPDVLIPFLRFVNLQTLIASPIKYKKRIIFTLRNSPYEKRGIIEIAHEFLVNHFNRTIVQNEYQKKYYKKSAQDRISILPNPVNEIFLEEKTSAPRNPFIAVSSGRLISQKNFPMLIEAFGKFSENKNDVELHIYGDGDDKEMLQSLIDKANLSSKIKLMGRSNDLVSVYKNASLYILSSNFEGMPNALLEAMAIGLPCVSTDCPTGPNEMIVDGENGLLVPVDNAQKMQEAIEYIYNNEAIAKEMGEKARLFVDKNNRVSSIVSKFEKIVE